LHQRISAIKSEERFGGLIVDGRGVLLGRGGE
jgi:hypothetical protein